MRFVVRGALLRAFAFFFLSSFFQTMMEKKQFLRERESPRSCSVFRACQKAFAARFYPPFFCRVYES
jgi:hypothetical protein